MYTLGTYWMLFAAGQLHHFILYSLVCDPVQVLWSPRCWCEISILWFILDPMHLSRSFPNCTFILLSVQWFSCKCANVVCAVGEVQKKMKNLRTQFAKECKKYVKSGSGADDRKWKYYQAMLFLQGFTVQTTSTMSNLTHEPVAKFCYICMI